MSDAYKTSAGQMQSSEQLHAAQSDRAGLSWLHGPLITITNSAGPAGAAAMSSPNALARFEYEAGRTHDCTKVLMIEWREDGSTKAIKGSWEIGWPGKKPVVFKRDLNQDINRLYFLLSATERVPAAVFLVLKPKAMPEESGTVTWKVNPMPAIFSPELGASAVQAGKKGVLHTIWAKRRLQVLNAELDAGLLADTLVQESNAGRARQERDWIHEHFGVQLVANAAKATSTAVSPASIGSGQTLQSQGLGIQVGSGASEDAATADDLRPSLPRRVTGPLSPEQTDIAVGSFSGFASLHCLANSQTLAAKPSQRPATGVTNTLPSVDEGNRLQAPTEQKRGHGGEDGQEDGLFALPLSPRAATTGQSPFSFDPTHTSAYLGAP